MIKHIFLTLILVLALCVTACAPQKYKKLYPSGRDTVASYGDGTYQLLRTNDFRVLANEKYHESVAGKIVQIRATEEKVYAIGTGSRGHNADERRFTIFVVVTLSDNMMQCYILPEDPSEPDIPNYGLDEMVENNDAQRIYEFTDFSDEDQMVFTEMLRYIADNMTEEQPKQEYYSMEDFESIIIGESTYRDVNKLVPVKKLYADSHGGFCEYPMESGGAIRIKFRKPDYVVWAIEDVPPEKATEGWQGFWRLRCT